MRPCLAVRPQHWRRALSAGLLLIAALGAATIAHARPQTEAPAARAEDLYDQAVEARRTGRHEPAVSLLRRAAALEPNNADIRLQLGLALMGMQRFDEAERELQLALNIAPRYVDVEIALARIDLWRGHHAKAEDRARRLVHDNPEHKDAAELLATVEASAVATAPPAPQQDPPALRLSRFDGSFAYAHLSGGRDPWREGALAAAFALPSGDVLIGLIEQASRFGHSDTYLEIRFDTKLAPRYGAYALLGGTPDAEFKPEAAIAGGGWWQAVDRDGAWHALRFTIDAKYAAFATGDVLSLILGLEAEFLDGDLLVGLRQINLIDETDAYQNGYALQARLQASETMALLGGWAQAPDTSEGRTFETRTAYAGVQLALWQDVTATATYAHDELEGLYDRSTGTLAISYRLSPS